MTEVKAVEAVIRDDPIIATRSYQGNEETGVTLMLGSSGKLARISYKPDKFKSVEEVNQRLKTCKLCTDEGLEEFLKSNYHLDSLDKIEEETAQRILGTLCLKYNVPAPHLEFVDNQNCTNPNFGVHTCERGKKKGTIRLCKGCLSAHTLTHEFKHHLDCMKGKPDLGNGENEVEAEEFALAETRVAKKVKYANHLKDSHHGDQPLKDLMDILGKWGPQFVAKAGEMGFDYLDTVITGWPVKPSLALNAVATAGTAFGAFMAKGPIDEMLAIASGHFATKLVDYLKDYMAPAAGARLGGQQLTYIPSTGQYVPTRPGLSQNIRYAPEQRVVTAPKFSTTSLRPKYQLGS